MREYGDKMAVINATRYRYCMPEVYDYFLKELVLKDRDIDRKLERTTMIIELGWNGKQLPVDFPTEEQVGRRITGVKYSLWKKMG